MALPVTIPNTFANATSSIPLSQLDTNFSTLANAVNGLNSGSETLANLKATTANVGVLTVTGNATIGDASTDTVTLNSTLTANTAVIFAAGTSAAPSITTTGDTNTGIFFPAADTIAFAEGGVESMRIDSSGNVGIGVTPVSTWAIGGSVVQIKGRGYWAATATNEVDFGINAYYDGSWRYLASSTAANYSIQNNTHIWQYAASGTAGNVITWSEAMRIDSSGNVGIGVTPSAWGGAYKAIQFGIDGVLNATTSTTNGVILAKNFFNNGAGNRYINTDFASFYQQISGQHQWFTAPSGTAGNAITFTQAMTLDASGRLGVGTTSPSYRFHAAGSSAALSSLWLGYNGSAPGSGNAFNAVYFGNGSASGADRAIRIEAYQDGGFQDIIGMRFYTQASDAGGPLERARITSEGRLLIGKTGVNFTIAGGIYNPGGSAELTVDGGTCLAVNRLTNDGTLVSFSQANVEEGTISVSGNTVSYNGFSGGHWTQLQQGRGYNPEILRGTVMSSIGEMCEWKSVVWDEVIEHPAVPAVEAKEAVVDEDGNVIEPAVEAVEGKDAWTETIPHREHYLGQLPVGATFEENGVTKTVVDDGNERLPKVKISDVVGDKAVYGVFQTYDEVQDMLVTSLGAFVVRIAAGVTVQIGDLLESNGDGCAKVQDDDVIRSRTIGKVTSTTPSATYADGSYIVPAVLYCG